MQFTSGGPDIPNKLLQEHEEGNVVFFCGAGISCEAGLPGFSGLVQKIYSESGIQLDDIEIEIYEKLTLDAQIEFLEDRHIEGRIGIRKLIANELDITTRQLKSTTLHKALLTLALNRKGLRRLVTTNFDHIFKHIIKEQKLEVQIYKAPTIPLAKTRWDGLVYLHGLLPEPSIENKSEELDNLITSSGDFGLAYIKDRWGSKFISELFRKFTVCFIGYSIDDPILRYMVDAIAADHKRGEEAKEVFAFAGYKDGQYEISEKKWLTKHVTPILFKKSEEKTALADTIQLWSEAYRDGLTGKEKIVATLSKSNPDQNTEQDNFVERMLWALSDPSGIPAKLFATISPPPMLEWLDHLSKNRFTYNKNKSAITLGKIVLDNRPAFSLVNRPYLSIIGPRMSFVVDALAGNLDLIMSHLGTWLTRHLNNPKLIYWLTKQECKLSPEFAYIVHKELANFNTLESKNDTEELNKIRSQYPDAIPSKNMRTLWGLLLSERYKQHDNLHYIHMWIDNFKRYGLTDESRIHLVKFLTPVISITGLPQQSLDAIEHNIKIRNLISYEVVLSINSAFSIFSQVRNNSLWEAALPLILNDLTSLLTEYLKLKQKLGDASNLSDLSYIAHPSIEKHVQNRQFRDWTILIELLTESWLATSKTNSSSARIVATQWMNIPFPLFKRLAFFAATHKNIIPVKTALNWLLSSKHRWLWSTETKRETMRLISALSQSMTNSDQVRLENAILLGPSRNLDENHIEEEAWQQIKERSIWLKLKKLESAGCVLNSNVAAILEKISAKNSDWYLEQNEREEFPFYMITSMSSLDSDTLLPSNIDELILLIDSSNNQTNHKFTNSWRNLCKNNISIACGALYKLQEENKFYADRWNDALQAWTNDTNMLKISWEMLSGLIVKLPDMSLTKIISSVGYWLQEVAKILEDYDEKFFCIIDKVLECERSSKLKINADAVSSAINHPVGMVTEALMRLWYKQSLKDNQGIDANIKAIITILANTNINIYRHGRVILAANVISLLRVDTKWTSQHILTLFDWSTSKDEAKAAWEGFLWSPRIYLPFFKTVKVAFLETSRHSDILGRYAEQYASLLTFVCLENHDLFSKEELAKSISQIPIPLLPKVILALENGLDSASEQREAYWNNRIVPFIKHIWPKRNEFISQAISERFSLLCIASDNTFEEALELLFMWLQPLVSPLFVVNQLHAATIIDTFPKSSLKFLSKIIGNNFDWPPPDLQSCLNRIAEAEPYLKSDKDYIRLNNIVKS